MNEQRPTAATEAFNQLADRLSPMMVVVTTNAGDEHSGCLVGFHSQCGLDPPRYAVWLSKANHTYRVAEQAEFFAVHFLTDEQHDLAELFGHNSGDDLDKFEHCAWTRGPRGLPLLDDCPYRFIGRKLDWADMGVDHACVMLEPIDASTGDGQPRWLDLRAATDIEPGHDADEAP